MSETKKGGLQEKVVPMVRKDIMKLAENNSKEVGMREVFTPRSH